MIHSMQTEDAPDARPLHVRIAAERRRRMKTDRATWTQEAVAKRAGISKRTYGSFEKGQTAEQSATRRAILRVFGMDETAEDTRDETLESFPADVQVFTEMLGAFLSTMDEAERIAFIKDTTRRIVGYRQ